jgi:RiboL-PSP-HEPN
VRTRSKARSPALKDFWVNLKEVGTLMALCETVENTPRLRRSNESLARAPLVLLCSHLENFFETLVIDILQFHESNQTSIAELPDQLRLLQVCQGLTMSDDPQKKWLFICKLHQSPFSEDSQFCTEGVFKSEFHLKGFASPGSKEIERLLRTVGVESIWKSIEARTGSLILKSSLDSFVNRRNNVAHGNSSDKPTINDVKSTIKDMCQLVRICNVVVEEYLVSEFKTQELWCWKI